MPHGVWNLGSPTSRMEPRLPALGSMESYSGAKKVPVMDIIFKKGGMGKWSVVNLPEDLRQRGRRKVSGH